MSNSVNNVITCGTKLLALSHQLFK